MKSRIIFLVFSILIYFLINKKWISDKEFDVKKKILNIGLYSSIIFILVLTVFPITKFEYTGFKIANFIPFEMTKKIYMKNSIWYTLYQVVGNIALYVPLGFFLLFKTNSKLQSFLYCCFVTLNIEFMQGFIPYRYMDIDDIIYNALGGLIGVMLATLFIKIFKLFKLDDTNDKLGKEENNTEQEKEQEE